MVFQALFNCRRSDRPCRGSAVVTVLVLAAVTAVIAAGFISRASAEARLAHRSFYRAAVLHLAEAGVEEGLHALNTNSVATGGTWSLASGSTTDYVRTLSSGFDFPQATGAVYIRIDNAASAAPTVTAAGVVTIPNQPKLVKQIRVGGKTSSRIWSNTLVARGNITLSGTADIDSYDSSLGPYNSSSNRSDRATVATSDHITLTGSASIYGYVATAGAKPKVGGSGRIYGATSPSGTGVDSSRVRTDFNANLTDASPPAAIGYNLGAYSVGGSIVAELPRTGDLPGANGRYLYTCSSLSVTDSARLDVNGPVDVVVTGNISIDKSGRINVGAVTTIKPSLNLYSPGKIDLGGSGIVNNTQLPTNVAIWGTKPSGTSAQTITLSSSTGFYGTIYGANAEITLSNLSDIYGAVIGRDVKLTGSAAIHYDTQLANATSAGGPIPGASATLGTVHIASWVELNASPGSGSALARDNRAPFAPLF